MRYVLFLLLLLGAGAGWAADYSNVTATITFTNTTVAGDAATINGSTRTFTNGTPANTLFLSTGGRNQSATNLFRNLGANRLSSPPVSVTFASTNVVKIFGSAVAVTFSVPFATVDYVTNSGNQTYSLDVPVYNIPTAQTRTNNADYLVDYINNYSLTNQFRTNAPVLSNFVSIGYGVKLVQGNLTLYRFQGTNASTIWGGKYDGPEITNATQLGGVVQALTGGLWSDGFMLRGNASNLTYVSTTTLLASNGFLVSMTNINPVFTNGVNYGNAFSSPGSGLNSQQFGSGALATNAFTTAVGYNAFAYGLNSLAYGYTALATNFNSTAIGTAAEAWGTSAIAIGPEAWAYGTRSIAIGEASYVPAIYENSTVIGYAATATASNQVRLGDTSQTVSIPGVLEAATTTNSTFTGTNKFAANSALAFTRKAVTSLANGNNAAVPVHTNVFVEVSGPSAVFTINGLDSTGVMDGQMLIILNQTGYDMTVAHQSGTDPTAANRIITLTGADRTTTGNGAATLLYSGAAARWILISFDP